MEILSTANCKINGICHCGSVNMDKAGDICTGYKDPKISVPACKYDIVNNAPCKCGEVADNAENGDNCTYIGD